MKLSIAPKERRSKALPRVLRGEEKAGSVAEETAGDGMLLVSTNLCDPSIFNGSNDATGIRTIAVTESLSGFDHVAEEYSTGQLSGRGTDN